MKLKIAIYFLFTLINLNLLAQNQNEVTRNLREKNKIEKKLTYKHKLENNDSILISEEFYDRNGNILKDIRFNDEGKYRWKYLLEYSNNLMIKQTGYNENEQVSTILTYQYDANGNQIEYKQLKPDLTVIGDQKRIYNDKNQNTELHNWKKDEDIFFLSQKYFYTDFNLYSLIESYNNRKELLSKSEYEYDENKNLLAVYIIINGKREQIRKNVYVNNLLIESTAKYSKQTIQVTKTTKYSYDSEKNIIEELIYEDGELKEKKSYSLIKFSS